MKPGDYVEAQRSYNSQEMPEGLTKSVKKQSVYIVRGLVKGLTWDNKEDDGVLLEELVNPLSFKTGREYAYYASDFKVLELPPLAHLDIEEQIEKALQQELVLLAN